MESLNLNALAGSLPTSNLANAEKELINNFRGISLLSPCPIAICPTEIVLNTPRLFFSVPKSGGDEHNKSISLLTLDLQARVQLGLRCGVRRPAPDDPARCV